MNHAILSGLVLLTALMETSPCRRATNTDQDLTAAAGALGEEPETGSAAAVYQRYRFRHEILVSMKSDLSNLVKAQEAYFADSSKYTSTTSCVRPTVAGTAAWCASRGNTLGSITVTAGGWWATITNINTGISCAVEVGPDTTFGVPAGTPACFGVVTPPPGYPKSRY